MQLIKAKYPDVIFRLVGWIDENPAAISREVLKTSERDGIIENLGKLDEVRPAIADSSVYVLPSYREGTPRTVLEAMAMGRLAIITKTGAVPDEIEVEQKGCGVFVAPGDPTSLADAIEAVARDPEESRAMGMRGRELCKKHGIELDERYVWD